MKLYSGFSGKMNFQVCDKPVPRHEEEGKKEMPWLPDL